MSQTGVWGEKVIIDVIWLAAILNYSKDSAGIFGIFTDSDYEGFKGTFLKNSAFYIIF